MPSPTPHGRSTIPAGLTLDRLAPVDPARRRSDAAVDRFWAWWNDGGAAESAEAMQTGDAVSVVPEITSLVEDIDAGLVWEFGPGRDGARHTLTVTAAGVPELRGAARRWLAGAPEDDPVWEFADLREPVEGTAMFFRGRRFAFTETLVEATCGLSMVDVVVHHPELAALSPDDAEVAAYLLLEAVVGEAAVEKWVRRIAVGTGPVPTEGVVLLPELRGLLERVAADNVDEDGSPAWQILQGECADGPVVAMVRTPAVSLSAPEFDQYVSVAVPYTDVVDCGLPGPGSLSGLRDLEDHLSDRVAGSAECVGAESFAGRRTLHFYADASTPAAEQLRAAAAGWEQGPVEVTSVPDPGWQKVRHLRV